MSKETLQRVGHDWGMELNWNERDRYEHIGQNWTIKAGVGQLWSEKCMLR